MHRPTSVALATVLAAALALAVAPAPARAEISGPCDATVNGISIADRHSRRPAQAIALPRDELATLAVSAPPRTRHTIRLALLTVSIPIIENRLAEQGSLVERVRLRDHLPGTGLYRVLSETTNESGGVACTGAAMIDVGGNPLFTLLGASAAAVVTAGGVAVAMTTGFSINAGRKWKLTLAAKVGARRDEVDGALALERQPLADQRARESLLRRRAGCCCSRAREPGRRSSSRWRSPSRSRSSARCAPCSATASARAARSRRPRS
ncbi:MAG: hypothetical protein FJZ92_14605, partial [Chloroflexi bacterium]|nr:hypothetical protein [Chloroflexota bacterium]